MNVYIKEHHRLRSHRVNMTFDPILPGHYVLECCKDYLIEIPSIAPFVLQRWPHVFGDTCQYHSRFNLKNKGTYYAGNKAYTTISVHKPVKCPCLGFVCFSRNDSRGPTFAAECRLPIKIVSYVEISQI
jgi:hypothetical protein